MFLEFFTWWYGEGLLDSWRSTGRLISHIQLTFSISGLLRNLLAPWRQIISPPGRSLEDKFRAVVDNLISRTIGFFVRLGTLLVAAVVIILGSILGVLVALIWPLLPIALVYCLIRVAVG